MALRNLRRTAHLPRKKYEYLGTDIDYSVHGKITFSVEKYTRNIIDKFTEDLGKTAKTPAEEHLFTVSNDNTHHHLPEKQEQIFHCTVAQILFLVT